MGARWSTDAMPKRSPGSDKRSINPIDRIIQEHALQLRLCDMLEHIADGLPQKFDKGEIAEAGATLCKGMTAHFALEENILFPLLSQRARSDPHLSAVIAQIAKEHDRDEDLSGELAEELRLVVETGKVRNPDMLGYMLRGYFVSLRRHIEWEDALIIPAARRLLTTQDLEQLSAAMGP